jgi:uncharacterized coiled-coil protein SlyX
MYGDLDARLAAIEWKLSRVLHALHGLHDGLDALQQGAKRMSQELDALTAQVKQNTDAEQSAVTLLGKLGDLIRNSVNDPGALTKLANDLDASKAALAAAVVANTPADANPPTNPPAAGTRGPKKP